MLVTATAAVDDACSSVGCQEICLSSAASSVTCACRSDDTRVLDADQRLCLRTSLQLSHLHSFYSAHLAAAAAAAAAAAWLMELDTDGCG